MNVCNICGQSMVVFFFELSPTICTVIKIFLHIIIFCFLLITIFIVCQHLQHSVHCQIQNLFSILLWNIISSFSYSLSSSLIWSSGFGSLICHPPPPDLMSAAIQTFNIVKKYSIFTCSPKAEHLLATYARMYWYWSTSKVLLDWTL